MKRARGFTLLELLIGLVITAMVLAAMAAVSFAVATNWKNADSADSSYNRGSQLEARMQQKIRPAASLGACVRGSISGGVAASVLFWEGDTTTATGTSGNDGIMEFNEIGLLYYDPTSKQLRLYDTSTDWSTWTTAAQTAANAVAGVTYLANPSSVSDFMTAAPNYRVLMRNVNGVVFNVVASTSTTKPLLEYVVSMTDSAGQSSVRYGSVTLVAPVTASN